MRMQAPRAPDVTMQLLEAAMQQHDPEGVQEILNETYKTAAESLKLSR